jgi:hypothetical protein
MVHPKSNLSTSKLSGKICKSLNNRFDESFALFRRRLGRITDRASL